MRWRVTPLLQGFPLESGSAANTGTKVSHVTAYRTKKLPLCAVARIRETRAVIANELIKCGVVLLRLLFKYV